MSSVLFLPVYSLKMKLDIKCVWTICLSTINFVLPFSTLICHKFFFANVHACEGVPRNCNTTHKARCEVTTWLYSVPHYKTGFLIFGHLVDYLQNHAISTHNTSKLSLFFTESFDTNVNTSRDNHMTHDRKQQCQPKTLWLPQ